MGAGQVCLAARAGPGKDVGYLEQLWEGAVKIALRHVPDRLAATTAEVARSPPSRSLARRRVPALCFWVPGLRYRARA